MCIIHSSSFSSGDIYTSVWKPKWHLRCLCGHEGFEIRVMRPDFDGPTTEVLESKMDQTLFTMERAGWTKGINLHHIRKMMDQGIIRTLRDSM